MSIRILHSSDLHGKYKTLLNGDFGDWDLWLDTGDFFDNVGRVSRTGYTILPEAEKISQSRWLGYKDLGHRFKEWLNGRPAIIVPGNHDFVSLANHLIGAGCPNVHSISPEGVNVLGLHWSGFREIPRIASEWAGEIDDFSDLTERVFSGDPDILVTHAPPAGILDGYGGYGILELTSGLTYREHRIRHHFFGHEHRDGGRTEEKMGIEFHNGACHARVHVIK
jgi:Icc-related predicted phosphoesterase